MTTRAEDTTADRLQAARSAYRTLLVHAQADPDAQPRLAAAAALARKLDATLVGLGAEEVQTIGVGDPMGILSTQAMAELEKQVRRRLDQAEAAFREAAQDLRTIWIGRVGLPTPAMAKASRAADLIVAGGSTVEFQDSFRSCDPAELVLQSGRPVLVAPPKGGALDASAIVVAWRDTREARRTLADSLPFLQGARDVVVVEVCAQDELTEAQLRTAEVVDGLKRHGVAARAKAVVAAASRVASELQATADVVGADLIVSGAYGHSRFGEWIFGGVTRELLQRSQRFLLLSH